MYIWWPFPVKTKSRIWIRQKTQINLYSRHFVSITICLVNEKLCYIYGHRGPRKLRIVNYFWSMYCILSLICNLLVTKSKTATLFNQFWRKMSHLMPKVESFFVDCTKLKNSKCILQQGLVKTTSQVLHNILEKWEFLFHY